MSEAKPSGDRGFAVLAALFANTPPGSVPAEVQHWCARARRALARPASGTAQARALAAYEAALATAQRIAARARATQPG